MKLRNSMRMFYYMRHGHLRIKNDLLINGNPTKVDTCHTVRCNKFKPSFILVVGLVTLYSGQVIYYIHLTNENRSYKNR